MSTGVYVVEIQLTVHTPTSHWKYLHNLSDAIFGLEEPNMSHRRMGDIAKMEIKTIEKLFGKIKI